MNAGKTRTSPLATIAIAAPLLISFIGVLLTFSTPRSQNDWFGMALIVKASGALIIASIVSIAFALAAFLRGEARASLSLFTAIPASVFLVFASSILIPAYSENAQLRKIREIRCRIISDAAYRQEYVMSDHLSIRDSGVFKEQEVADSLTPDQVRHLWNQWKGVETGWNFQALILSRNTPQDVLTNYYRIVIMTAEMGGWRPAQRYLEHEEYLLLHPNLPEPLLAEIETLNLPELNRIISRRKPQSKQ